MNIMLTVALFNWLGTGAIFTPVYDSGEPQVRPDGDLPYLSVWRVLDPLDNLSVRTVMPVKLNEPVTIDAMAFYSFNPKDPTIKHIDIYQGTDENGPGTILHELVFENHRSVREGWSLFVLDEPIELPAGKYGIAFHGSFEFDVYWAGNAPKGGGFAWVRPNDQIDWFKGTADDYGFVPNFGIRLLSRQAVKGTAGDAMASGAPVQRRAPQLAPPRDDDSAPGELPTHEYEPGTAPSWHHVIWRPLRNVNEVTVEHVEVETAPAPLLGD